MKLIILFIVLLLSGCALPKREKLKVYKITKHLTSDSVIVQFLYLIEDIDEATKSVTYYSATSSIGTAKSSSLAFVKSTTMPSTLASKTQIEEEVIEEEPTMEHDVELGESENGQADVGDAGGDGGGDGGGGD